MEVTQIESFLKLLEKVLLGDSGKPCDVNSGTEFVSIEGNDTVLMENVAQNTQIINQVEAIEMVDANGFKDLSDKLDNNNNVSKLKRKQRNSAIEKGNI